MTHKGCSAHAFPIHKCYEGQIFKKKFKVIQGQQTLWTSDRCRTSSNFYIHVVKLSVNMNFLMSDFKWTDFCGIGHPRSTMYQKCQFRSISAETKFYLQKLRHYEDLDEKKQPRGHLRLLKDKTFSKNEFFGTKSAFVKIAKTSKA